MQPIAIITTFRKTKKPPAIIIVIIIINTQGLILPKMKTTILQATAMLTAVLIVNAYIVVIGNQIPPVCYSQVTGCIPRAKITSVSTERQDIAEVGSRTMSCMGGVLWRP